MATHQTRGVYSRRVAQNVWTALRAWLNTRGINYHISGAVYFRGSQHSSWLIFLFFSGIIQVFTMEPGPASKRSKPAQAPALDVQHVSFKYGKVEVLKNINLSIPQGSRCLLVGDNGAGKSTLLKLLGGRHSKFNSTSHLLSPELTRLSPILLTVVTDGKLQVLGTDSYFNPSLNARRAFLGGSIPWPNR